MPTLRIDLYTEITCPWCIIGEHRLDTVLARRFADRPVEIVRRPVILMPDCPQAGMRIAELLNARYGITDPSAAWANPHAEARKSGLDLDLGRQAFAYPTLAAHTLIRLARPFGTQHGLARHLSAAYFRDALNIADPEILADIAAAHGFRRTEARLLAGDRAEQNKTRAEAADAMARGVRSVPHFVFAGRVALTGCQSEDALAASIETALSAAAAGPGAPASL
jgi:predicted DsbA family dithiol-disulfide isomerase